MSTLSLFTRPQGSLKNIKTVQDIWEFHTIQTPILLMSKPIIIQQGEVRGKKACQPTVSRWLPQPSSKTFLPLTLLKKELGPMSCSEWTLYKSPLDVVFLPYPLCILKTKGLVLPILYWIPKTQLETQMLSEPEFPADLGTLHTSSEAPVFPFSPFPWVPCHTKLLPLPYPQNMATLTQMVSILIPTKYCVV